MSKGFSTKNQIVVDPFKKVEPIDISDVELNKSDFVDKKYSVYETRADINKIYSKINFLNGALSGGFLLLTGLAIASSSIVFSTLCGSITLLSTYTLYKNIQVSGYRVKSIDLFEDGETIQIKTNTSTIETSISTIIPHEEYLKIKFPKVTNYTYESMPLYYLAFNSNLFIISRGFSEYDSKVLKSILYAKKIPIKH